MRNRSRTSNNLDKNPLENADEVDFESELETYIKLNELQVPRVWFVILFNCNAALFVFQKTWNEFTPCVCSIF